MSIKIVSSSILKSIEQQIVSGTTAANFQDQIGDIPGRNFGFHVGDLESAVSHNYEELKKQIFSTDNIIHIVPNQTHSKNVLVVTDISKPLNINDCDAVVTNIQGVLIGVLSADCVPILLYDPINKVIGAVHAGWKGTALKIVQEALNKMSINFKTNPSDILAFIGPCIGQDAYEVDTVVSNQMHPESYVLGKENGKFQLDLKKENQIQLLEYNVNAKNIEMSNDCTYTKNKTYYSARRNGFNTGRMLTYICLKNPSNTNQL
jgi:YfiH family protein